MRIWHAAEPLANVREVCRPHTIAA